jgi:hypothetical protein
MLRRVKLVLFYWIIVAVKKLLATFSKTYCLGDTKERKLGRHPVGFASGKFKRLQNLRLE